VANLLQFGCGVQVRGFPGLCSRLNDIDATSSCGRISHTDGEAVSGSLGLTPLQRAFSVPASHLAFSPLPPG
jgi:hypothetical protein